MKFLILIGRAFQEGNVKLKTLAFLFFVADFPVINYFLFLLFLKGAVMLKSNILEAIRETGPVETAAG